MSWKDKCVCSEVRGGARSLEVGEDGHGSQTSGERRLTNVGPKVARGSRQWPGAGVGVEMGAELRPVTGYAQLMFSMDPRTRVRTMTDRETRENDRTKPPVVKMACESFFFFPVGRLPEENSPKIVGILDTTSVR